MGTIASFSGHFSFLSNFFISPLEYQGLIFVASENAFQAAKTMDQEVRKQFCNMRPGEAKRAGRALVLRPNWDTIRDGIMLDIVRSKFQNPTLAAMLYDTGTDYLIEDNTWGDTYWGQCGGVGENKLGKILERIRFELWEKGIR